jgi:uncharacterized protein YukE
MPSRRNDIDHEAYGQKGHEGLTPDEAVSHAASGFPVGVGAVDPLYGRGGSAGFTNPRGPLAEEAKQDNAGAEGDKPEGWDDPWYWVNASDQDIPDNLSPAQEAVFALRSYYLFGDSRSYHFGSAGSARVETEAIRACAASGKQTLEQIEELITTMMSYVAASEEYWKGSTGDDFRQSFLEGMKALTHDLQNLAPYTRELIAYADKYDDVITEANVIAEGIGDVVWQDV